jgi:acyl-CoA synthetase (NDP forming)
MEGFLEPKSVTVIGASSDPLKGGYALVSNLKEKFPERLYPVNPRSDEICGLRSFKSVRELPEAVDLAVVFVPAASVPGILEECGLSQISRVIIQSGGFAETGERGVALQQECVAIARRFGMRLWGPNCMGVVNGQSGMVASFMRPDIWRGHLKAGDVSLIVQSGMLSAGFLLQVLREGYFGLSKACSIGNRCDVNECDLLEYFSRDPHTAVVAMYIESIADVPRFRSAVLNLHRPLVLLKGGTTDEGAVAARSHTASLAQNTLLAEGFFRQLGIYRAFDFMEMMDLARALTLWKGRNEAKKIGVLSFSGASGIVATDHIIQHGMRLASLSSKTLEALKMIFPPWMRPGNPVDIWPAIERVGRKKAYSAAAEAIVQDPEVEGIYLHLYVDSTIFQEAFDFVRPLRGAKKPVAIWVMGDPQCFRALRDQVEPIGIPVYTEIERGALALAVMANSRVSSPW